MRNVLRETEHVSYVRREEGEVTLVVGGTAL